MFGKILRATVLRRAERTRSSRSGLIEFERHEDYKKVLNLQVN